MFHVAASKTARAYTHTQTHTVDKYVTDPKDQREGKNMISYEKKYGTSSLAEQGSSLLDLVLRRRVWQDCTRIMKAGAQNIAKPEWPCEKRQPPKPGYK